MSQYDVIVIGAGSGGLGTSVFMNQAGFKVLLIDKSDKSIGGDCLNFGCVPSKALIHTAKLVYAAKESNEFGLKVSGTVDFTKVKFPPIVRFLIKSPPFKCLLNSISAPYTFALSTFFQVNSALAASGLKARSIGFVKFLANKPIEIFSL